VAPSQPRLSSLKSFDFSTTDWRDSLRGALVTAIVTAIPVLNGDPKLAIPLSIGAVFAAVSEAGQPFGSRWKTMLWTTAGLMGAAFLGQSLSDLTLLAIVVTAPVAFLTGVIGARGRRAAVGGLLALVIFSIYVGIPVPLQDAPTTVLLVGLGGVTQTIVTIAMGVLRGQHREPSSVEPKKSGWNRPFVIHGIRLAIVMVIATAISENISLPHPYWLPMSVAWMSKPDTDGTVDRVMHRLAGTVLGLTAMGIIDVLFRPSGGGYLVVSLIGAAITIAFIWVNYAVAVTGVTMWIIAIFAMVGDPVVSTIEIRLAATCAAALLVVLVTWLPALASRKKLPTSQS
jgi:uncharacterized membrane protein YccC